MDNERIEELFEGLGPVSIRKLFGGKGIYFDGFIVAIVLRGELLLKADEQSAPRFRSRRLQAMDLYRHPPRQAGRDAVLEHSRRRV
ncbi:hypothetical protein X733_28570 [Mesorhizobium sp. L2C067A000]|nr:hypothetical protein X733_28570 [Mesorhizobium sp. L2C067A000]